MSAWALLGAFWVLCVGVIRACGREEAGGYSALGIIALSFMNETSRLVCSCDDLIYFFPVFYA